MVPFLVMTYFLLRDYNLLPKKELHWSPWVGSRMAESTIPMELPLETTNLSDSSAGAPAEGDRSSLEKGPLVQIIHDYLRGRGQLVWADFAKRVARHNALHRIWCADKPRGSS